MFINKCSSNLDYRNLRLLHHLVTTTTNNSTNKEVKRYYFIAKLRGLQLSCPFFGVSEEHHAESLNWKQEPRNVSTLFCMALAQK